MSSCLMTVVMPSFNQGRFIAQAIDSVLRQAPPAVQLLVVDGGSTDGTLAVLEEKLRRYGGRLRWISEPDGGPAAALNKGFRAVSSELVGWLNSDDLYDSGAIANVTRCFADNPDLLMVYGEGDHVDADGQFIERYPTRPPAASLRAFASGCYICQPTVFLRREVFASVGYLDETLRASFDFDFWMRIFRAHPERIRHLDAVLAKTRLHDATITSRARRSVALEGIRILHRQLGEAPLHWAETYFNELFARYPLASDVLDLHEEIDAMLLELRPYFPGEQLDKLRQRLLGDARVRAAAPGIYVDISADGWASPNLMVRIRRRLADATYLKLLCAHSSPRNNPLLLEVVTSWGERFTHAVQTNGRFELIVDVAGVSGEGHVIWISTRDFFIPARLEPGSSDNRQLAFRVLESSLY